MNVVYFFLPPPSKFHSVGGVSGSYLKRATSQLWFDCEAIQKQWPHYITHTQQTDGLRVVKNNVFGYFSTYFKRGIGNNK